MITLNDLRERLNDARRSRNKMEISVLSMLIGELTANAKMVNGVKTVSDLDVVTHLQKHLKKLHETLAIKRKKITTENGSVIFGGLPEDTEALFVASFLPVMLTEAEMHQIIKDHNFANVGAFMSHMKANHAGMYDGKMATETFKRFMQVE